MQPETGYIDTKKIAQVSLPFIQNQGQADDKVRFYANTFAGTVYVTEDDITYSVIKQNSNDGVQAYAIKEKFLGATLNPTGLDRSDSTVS